MSGADKFVRLRARTLIVTYDMLGEHGHKTGGGSIRIDASNADSMVKQMNVILDGRRYKIMDVMPVT